MWATTLALLYCFFNSQMDFDGITLLNLYIRIVTILSKMVELFALSHIYFKMFQILWYMSSWFTDANAAKLRSKILFCVSFTANFSALWMTFSLELTECGFLRILGNRMNITEARITNDKICNRPLEHKTPISSRSRTKSFIQET